MIQEFQISNAFESVPLILNLRTSDVDEGLLIFNIDGLGSSKGTVDGKPSPNMDGLIDSSTKVGARYITFTIVVVPGLSEETAKKKIYSYFPVKETITLRVITDQKDAYIDALVESAEINQFAKVENAVITLVCSKPYFIDNVQQADGVAPGIGTLISYYGEVKTGVEFVIDFTGLLTTKTIILANTQGSQILTLDVTNVLARIGGTQNPINGDQIKLDTRVGQKKAIYIRSGVEYDMIDAVDVNSNWIQLIPGTASTNGILWSTGIGQSPYVTVSIYWRELYQGI